MAKSKTPPPLKSEIRYIHVVYAGGAYGKAENYALFAYGRRQSDCRKVRCKMGWDMATGIRTVSSFDEKTEFTAEEWSKLLLEQNEYKQRHLSNEIMDARKPQPKP